MLLPAAGLRSCEWGAQGVLLSAGHSAWGGGVAGPWGLLPSTSRVRFHLRLSFTSEFIFLSPGHALGLFLWLHIGLDLGTVVAVVFV